VGEKVKVVHVKIMGMLSFIAVLQNGKLISLSAKL
jgi:hypothetical protein